MSRYDTDNPTISLEDAIIALDKVSSRIAIQKSSEIRRERGIGVDNSKTNSTSERDEEVEDIDNENKLESLNTHDVTPTAGVSVEGKNKIVGDDTVWETQMYPLPRDIQLKGVNESWIKRKLRSNRSK